MELKVRVYVLQDGQRFMGIGVYWLLCAVRDTGSLRKAALSLELSYTKALRMISGLEAGFGCRILDRRRGGQSREGATLTPFGEEVLRLYGELMKAAEGKVSLVYDDFIKKIEKAKQEMGEPVGKQAQEGMPAVPR